MTWSDVCDGVILIVSMEGKELKNFAFTQTDCIEVSTDGLAQGCYTVMRLNKEGVVLESKKLIVK